MTFEAGEGSCRVVVELDRVERRGEEDEDNVLSGVGLGPNGEEGVDGVLRGAGEAATTRQQLKKHKAHATSLDTPGVDP